MTTDHLVAAPQLATSLSMSRRHLDRPLAASCYPSQTTHGTRHVTRDAATQIGHGYQTGRAQLA